MLTIASNEVTYKMHPERRRPPATPLFLMHHLLYSKALSLFADRFLLHFLFTHLLPLHPIM